MAAHPSHGVEPMNQNSVIRKGMYEAAQEQHRAGSAWRQAGYQFMEILRLYQESLRAERNGHSILHDVIRDKVLAEAAGGTAVRSGWDWGQGLEPEHFLISLAGGGPAVRITGNLNRYGGAEDPVLEYQDWGTSWLEFRLLNDIERNALDWFCNQFYWPGA